MTSKLIQIIRGGVKTFIPPSSLAQYERIGWHKVKQPKRSKKQEKQDVD